MEELTDLDSLRSLINKISTSLENEIKYFMDQVNDRTDPVNNTPWHSLPTMSPHMPIVAAVDGGSRSLNTRGSKILFAQAAGRIMGPEEVKNEPWQITRRTMISVSDLAEDLLGLLRQKLEIMVSLKLLKSGSPKYLMVDGTLETLFRVGVPSRIANAWKDSRNIQPEVEVFFNEIVAYGSALSSFLEEVQKSDVRVLGIPKDNYTKKFVSAKSEFTDTTFFSVVSKEKAGYSMMKEIDAQKTLGRTVVPQIWEKENIKLPDGFDKLKTFYCSIKDKGTPIRIDQFASVALGQEELLADLLTLSDEQDWFIPPRLAHEKAVIKSDFFEALYQGVYTQVSNLSPLYAKLILGGSRRSRTQ